MNPLFDPAWYQQYRQVRESGADPWRHYTTGGVTQALDPNAWFDTSWYLSEYPDVAASGIDPLDHYLRFGAAEGRDPGPTFSTTGYLAWNLDVAAAGMNPLLHFLRFGMDEGRQAPSVAEERSYADRAFERVRYGVDVAPARTSAERLPGMVVTPEPAPADARSRMMAGLRIAGLELPAGSHVVIAGATDAGMQEALATTTEPILRAGEGPSDGALACTTQSVVGMIELARWRDATHFLIPATLRWWLGHYAGLGAYLDASYARVDVGDDAGAMWALQEPCADLDAIRIVSALGLRIGRPPVILDWGADRRLADALRSSPVQPFDRLERSLPYLDDSIDVVLVPGRHDDECAREAARVARHAVISVGAQGTELVWEDPDLRPQGRVAVLVPDADGLSPSWLQRLMSSLPWSMDASCYLGLVDPSAAHADRRWSDERDRVTAVRAGSGDVAELLQRVASVASSDTIVLLDAATVPLPGAIEVLLATLGSRPEAAATCGLLIGSDGRVVAGGLEQAIDGTPTLLGRGRDRTDDPTLAYVRSVDGALPTLLAIRRTAVADATSASLEWDIKARVEWLELDGLLYDPGAIAMWTAMSPTRREEAA
jgi:hypothetical protein